MRRPQYNVYVCSVLLKGSYSTTNLLLQFVQHLNLWRTPVPPKLQLTSDSLASLMCAWLSAVAGHPPCVGDLPSPQSPCCSLGLTATDPKDGCIWEVFVNKSCTLEFQRSLLEYFQGEKCLRCEDIECIMFLFFSFSYWLDALHIIVVVINDALSQIFECPVLSSALGFFSLVKSPRTVTVNTHLSKCLWFLFVFFLPRPSSDVQTEQMTLTFFHLVLCVLEQCCLTLVMERIFPGRFRFDYNLVSLFVII